MIVTIEMKTQLFETFCRRPPGYLDFRFSFSQQHSRILVENYNRAVRQRCLNSGRVMFLNEFLAVERQGELFQLDLEPQTDASELQAHPTSDNKVETSNVSSQLGTQYEACARIAARIELMKVPRGCLRAA